MTVDQVIEAYLKYRNKKEALEAEIKDQVKELKDKMVSAGVFLIREEGSREEYFLPSNNIDFDVT